MRHVPLSGCMVNKVTLLQEGRKGRNVHSFMPAQMQLLQHAPPHVLQCHTIMHLHAVHILPTQILKLGVIQSTLYISTALVPAH